MKDETRIIDIDARNVEEQGFFCYKSKPKSEGYQRKLVWLRKRFDEGMQIKILFSGKRSFAFIEYLPGEFAWRAVEAPGFLVIHCLWVVGKGKGRGYGSRLIELCLEEAEAEGKAGVAMVTSRGNWLAGSELLLKKGFEVVDTAPPGFELLVKPLTSGPRPQFPVNWEDRRERLGRGMTVIRTDQCPYLENAVDILVETAAEHGVPARVVEYQDSRQVRQESPSPYGVFGIVLDGRMLSYHYLTRNELVKMLADGGQA